MGFRVRILYVVKLGMGLDPFPKAKHVLGTNNVLLLLTHIWACGSCTFPMEVQGHALALFFSLIHHL